MHAQNCIASIFRKITVRRVGAQTRNGDFVEICCTGTRDLIVRYSRTNSSILRKNRFLPFGKPLSCLIIPYWPDLRYQHDLPQGLVYSNRKSREDTIPPVAPATTLHTIHFRTSTEPGQALGHAEFGRRVAGDSNGQVFNYRTSPAGRAAHGGH
jgi:hypothetical protein